MAEIEDSRREYAVIAVSMVEYSQSKIMAEIEDSRREYAVIAVSIGGV